MSHFFDSAPGWLSLRTAPGSTRGVRERSRRGSCAKRFYDVVLAGLGLAVLSPVLVALAFLIVITDGRPVFYRQKRIGRNGQPFEMWKFRTMMVDAEQNGPAITRGGDKRVTPIGRVLRAIKLDELPQLWNVVKGDMSLVGPRPEVAVYVEQYTREQREVLGYRPGITDLATLRFRHEEALLRQAGNLEEFYVRICMPRKIQMNLEYGRQANLVTDTWIILQTVCPSWLGVMCLYAVTLLGSLWLSLWAHFDFAVPTSEMMGLFTGLIWAVPVQAGFLLWRNQCKVTLGVFGLTDAQQLVRTLAYGLIAQLAICLTFAGCPRPGVLFTHFVLSGFLLALVRYSFQVFCETRKHGPSTTVRARRIAVIGAGELGAIVAAQLALGGAGDFKGIAFFDDDASKWGKHLHGIPVLGMPELLLEECWRHRFDQALIALPEGDPARLMEIRKMLAKANLKYETVPSLGQLVGC